MASLNRKRSRLRLQAQSQLFVYFWGPFGEICENAAEASVIIMEWPSSSSYWTLPCFESFRRKRGTLTALIDGCMAGLRSVRAKFRGELPKLRLEGSDTVKRGVYTPALCDRVLRALNNHVYQPSPKATMPHFLR